MNRLSGTILTGVTDQGYSWLAPVIFRGEKAQTCAAVQNKMNGLFITKQALTNPYALDYSLALVIQGLPTNILGLGISFFAPGAKGPSGGIIGNPHILPRSAEGVGEYIENGLSLAALPGGPGIIIAGSPEQAMMAISGIEPGLGGETVLKKISQQVNTLGITMAIAVTDGIETAGGGGLLIEGKQQWMECL